MMNGHKCYVHEGYLFAVALFDEPEVDDDTTDRVLRELNLPRAKHYEESQICIKTEHIIAFYPAHIKNVCILELSNGYQHRVRASYELIEHLILP